MNKKLILLGLLVVLGLTAACVIGTPAATPTNEPGSPQPLATATPSLPTEVPATPTELAAPIPTVVSGPPIAHLAVGTKLTFTKIDMKDALNGWATGSGPVDNTDHVLRTTNGGKTWKDMTPPEAAPTGTNGKTAAAFFMDNARAWVAYTQEVSLGGASLHIWSTQDSGATWKASSPVFTGMNAEFFYPGTFAFADANQGWLLVHVGAGMMHDWVEMFSTSDGGVNWTQVVDPQTSDLEMSCSKNNLWFLDANNGWVTGDCHAVRAGYYFYKTSDGGKTWMQPDLPAPMGNTALFTADGNGCGTYNLNFMDATHGFMMLSCYQSTSGGFNKLSYLYTTVDGGANWTTSLLPLPDGQFQMLNTTQGWYVITHVYKTLNGGGSWTPTATVTWTGQPDFVDMKTGWLIAAKDGQTSLVTSINGGTTWSIIPAVIAP